MQCKIRLIAGGWCAAATVLTNQNGGATGSPGVTELALAFFALVVTIGLVTYNARNDQLYDELVARAAAIERSLNIPDGAFSNRPRPWLRIKSPWLLRIKLLGTEREIGWHEEWKIDHRTAISMIYSASIALGLFGVVAYVLEVFIGEPPVWMNFIAVGSVAVVTYWSRLLIKQQTKSQREEM